MSTFRVNYFGLVADVHEKHLKEALATLGRMPLSEKKRLISSVRENLEAALIAKNEGKFNKLPKKLRQEIADNIGIWYATEVMAGRGGEALLSDEDN